MAQQHQPVGIVEIDPDPAMDTTSDENIGQTLRRLRNARAITFDGTSADEAICSSRTDWNQADDELCESILLLQADVRQLHYDLEIELAKLLDRLLAMS